MRRKGNMIFIIPVIPITPTALWLVGHNNPGPCLDTGLYLGLFAIGVSLSPLRRNGSRS